MKLTIYSYTLDDRRVGPSIYSFASKEARGEALREHLGEIAKDGGDELDPDGDVSDWAEQLGITLTFDSCVVEIPILDQIHHRLGEIRRLIEYSNLYPTNYDVKTEVLRIVDATQADIKALK